MFISPYDTTVCKSHRMDSIRRDVEQLKIEGELLRQTDRIYLVGPDSTQVQPFAHPMVIGEGDDSYLVADVRSAANIHRQTGELRGGSDLTYIRSRCSVMVTAWLDGNRHDLLSTGDFQIKVFARLLGENLQRRMNLAIETSIRIQIMAAMYYITLFEEEPIKGDDVVKAGKRISRSIGIPLPQVLDLIESLEPMMNLNDFCEMLKEHGNSVRLDRIAPAVVYTMLGGIWYGSNNTENVAVALEHPPTFATMVYMAQVDRGYRKSVLGQLVLTLGRRNDLADTFERHMRRLIETEH